MNNEKCFKYGERLRKLRKERGLSQEEVAMRADITTSYYGQLERGTANPTVLLLEKICAVMGFSLNDIFAETSTNLLGIDSLSMQVLQQIHGKTDREKELVLSLMKTAFKLQNEKQQKNPSKRGSKDDMVL